MKGDKRELILNSAERLMKSVSCNELSVSILAKEAGIAKGGIYYYFASKEEILYAVIERAYKKAVSEYHKGCSEDVPAIKKIRNLFKVIVRREFKNREDNILASLHDNDSALIHNYLKKAAIEQMSPVVEKILEQGVDEKSINISEPADNVAETMVTVITSIMDGIVFSDKEQMYSKLKLISKVLDSSLGAKSGTFGFFSEENIF